MAGTRLLRTPVHLSNDDRSEVHHGYRIVELSDLFLFAPFDILVLIYTFIAATIPACVIMNGIANVVTLDGKYLVVSVIRLPTSAWCPNDTCEAIFTDLVNNRLEVVVHGTGIGVVLSVLQIDRFIGELNADLTWVLQHEVLLRENIPYSHQVGLIIIAHLQVLRADTRRAYHHIHAVVHSHLCQLQEERWQGSFQTVGIELADVCLACDISRLIFCTFILIAADGTVRPYRVKM